MEEPLVFNYNSDNTYHTAPSTGRVKVLELIPIDSDSNTKEVKKVEGYNLCGCGQASHPILLSSDKNISVAENAIPIRIQVECVTFSDFLFFLSRLSPKHPFTCQNGLISYVILIILILYYLHIHSSFILSLKIITHDSYQRRDLYLSLSTLGHPEHRGHRNPGPEDT